MGTNKYLLNGKNGRLEIKNNYGKFEVLFDLQDYEIIKNYTFLGKGVDALSEPTTTQ